jgi:hypothetical protein
MSHVIIFLRGVKLALEELKENGKVMTTYFFSIL